MSDQGSAGPGATDAAPPPADTAPRPADLPPTPLRAPLLGFVAKYLIGYPTKWLLRGRVLGLDNVPASGPAIVASNHASYADPVLVGTTLRRPVRFMAKSELWENPLLAVAVRGLWSFPVHRAGIDRAALKTALDLLADGQLVGIFPEGRRNADGQAAAQAGVAFLALKAGVPIVPMAMDGTSRIRPEGTRFMRFPRVTISYGEPIDTKAFCTGSRREQTEALTAEIMRRIGEELERARTARSKAR